MRPYSRWTRAEEEWLIHQLVRGLAEEEIAESHNRSLGAIRRRVFVLYAAGRIGFRTDEESFFDAERFEEINRQMRWHVGGNVFRNFDDELLIQRLVRGTSIQEIAELHNCSEAEIQRRVFELYASGRIRFRRNYYFFSAPQTDDQPPSPGSGINNWGRFRFSRTLDRQEAC